MVSPNKINMNNAAWNHQQMWTLDSGLWTCYNRLDAGWLQVLSAFPFMHWFWFHYNRSLCHSQLLRCQSQSQLLRCLTLSELAATSECFERQQSTVFWTSHVCGFCNVTEMTCCWVDLFIGFVLVVGVVGTRVCMGRFLTWLRHTFRPSPSIPQMLQLLCTTTFDSD